MNTYVYSIIYIINSIIKMNGMRYDTFNFPPQNSKFIYTIPQSNEDFGYLEEISIHSIPSSQPLTSGIDDGIEWYNKHFTISNIKFPIPIFIIIFFLSICTIIGSIFAYNKNDCGLTINSSIPINYIDWLHIHFWTNIGTISIMIILELFTRLIKIELIVLKMVISRFGFLFQIVLYIFGCVLYFNEVNGNCIGSMVNIFGICVLIVQTIVFLIIGLQYKFSSTTIDS